jgi:hypothetical protein
LLAVELVKDEVTSAGRLSLAVPIKPQEPSIDLGHEARIEPNQAKRQFSIDQWQAAIGLVENELLAGCARCLDINYNVQLHA